MNFRLVRIAAGFAAILGMSSFALAGDNQTFTVVVPTSISITAPTAASITHDESNNPQAFPAQTWAVKGNVRSGVTVSFATSQPFVHAEDNTFKRNARLELALGTVAGPATWNVTTAADQTDYVNNDGIAQVNAESSGVGRANFNLTVKFITEEYGVFAAGNYVTTVTGTVAAK